MQSVQLLSVPDVQNIHLLMNGIATIMGKKEGWSLENRKNSEARIKANNRYNEKAYDRISIAIPKGKKAMIQEHAESHGMSVNGFIGEAIDEKIEKDGKM